VGMTEKESGNDRVWKKWDRYLLNTSYKLQDASCKIKEKRDIILLLLKIKSILSPFLLLAEQAQFCFHAGEFFLHFSEKWRE